MASPFDDPPVRSTSPSSIRAVSPTRWRGDIDTSSPSASADPTLRARGSPTLTRSLDPDARERQRTMDVDMALHLSRARRETLVQPTSPFDDPRTSSELPFGLFSAVEQHDLRLARGEESNALDQDIVHGGHGTAPDSTLDLRLNQPQDSSLLVAIEGQYPLPNHREPSPRYQVSSARFVFDFAPLENFAAEEKESLGLTSPIDSPVMRVRYPKGQRDDEQPKSPPSPGSGAFGLSVGSAAVPRRPGARQRKLSESAPLPRPHRRNGRAKVALFEHQANEPASGFSARLMATGQLSIVPSSEDVSGIFHRYASSPPPGIGAASPGHDRPYRFSFYSNALSATIHARSLCELPAEGQSFEDLFSGLPSPAPRREDATGEPLAFNAPVPMLASRPSIFIPNEKRTPSGLEGVPASYRNVSSGRPAEKVDPGRLNGSGPASSADAEANTWWLDIQCPTDEEMKVLSKVITPTLFYRMRTLMQRSQGIFNPPTNHRRHPNGGSSRED